MNDNILLNKSELIKKTVGECFDIRVKLTPDKTALEFQGDTYTWKELDELSDWLVWRFDQMGIRKGTRAAIWCGNNAQWVAVYLGLMKIGAIAVLINPGYLSGELHKIISYSKVEYLFYGEEFKGADLQEILDGVDISSVPHLKQTIPIELPDAVKMLMEGSKVLSTEQKARVAALRSKPKYDDVACMLFTSGTTDTPKGVMLTHYSIVNDSILSARAMHWTYEDKTCVMVPLFHCFGMTSCLLGSIMCGSCLYLMKYYRTIDALEGIQNHGCTVLNGVPSMFLAMVHNSRFDEFDLSTLKSGIIAGSPLSDTDYKFICSRLGLDRLLMSYGQTETSPGVSFSEYDETIDEKSDNAGYIIPYIEVCTWDRDQNQNIYYCDVVDAQGKTLTGYREKNTKVLNVGYESGDGVRRVAYCTQGDYFVTGEIGVRGFNVMKEYFENPEATAKTLEKDGWLHTGDLGYIDDKGRIHIVGRLKEMIIRGGENISPVEIEECIKELPSVKDVKVVGVPQKVLQEEIAACVVPVKNAIVSEEEIRDYCRQRLAGYKVPKYIRFYEELPLNSSSKVKIGELKKQMTAFAQASSKNK